MEARGKAWKILAGRETKASPWSNEMHKKGTAKPSDGEAALGYGEVDGAGRGRCIAADFGGVVDEVAGDCDWDTWSEQQVD